LTAPTFPHVVARVALAFAVLGLIIIVVGLALGALLNDRFLGFALLVAGGFLIILPYTRPHVDE